MKILTIWPAGMGAAGVGRLQALERRGMRVALLCAKAWPEGGALIRPLDALSFPTYPRRVAMRGKGAYYFFPGGIGRVVADFLPDLIHLREELYTVAGAQFLAERRVRFPEVPFIFESWQNIRKRYPWPLRWFESSGYRSATAAVAGAPGVEPVLRSGGFSKPIQVIPLGCIDPSVFTPEGPDMRERLPSKRLIGYAGRLIPAKGLDDLVKALATVDIPTALVIAGDGPERHNLESLAARLGVDLVMLGGIRENDMPSFLRSLDVFVLPSRTTPSWKEQWGRVLVEAMGCGVPVIGSNSGEIPYVIGNHGIVFPEGDTDSLAESMSILLSDASKHDRYKSSALERASSLTWTSHAKLMANFYRRIL